MEHMSHHVVPSDQLITQFSSHSGLCSFPREGKMYTQGTWVGGARGGIGMGKDGEDSVRWG